MTSNANEILISVDVETSGPIPGEFSMLSIGACLIEDDSKTFECSLKPINSNFDPAALKATGLKLETFEQNGIPPQEGMQEFRAWIDSHASNNQNPIFVGFNAPFDWSFINYYFLKYGTKNPFGFSALDIKAFYMGRTGCAWSETTSSQIAKKINPKNMGDHNPLHDAIYQAELFRLIRRLTVAR